MISDPKIQKAVTNIPQRSEKQTDLQKLVGSYVDIGILPQLLNRNSQIVYGRRGTGKTHLAGVLSSKLRERPSTIVVLIDARTLGSTAQFSDSAISLSRRCLSLFRDILGEIHNGILEHAVDHPTSDSNYVLGDLDALSRAATEPFAQRLVKDISERALAKAETRDVAGAQISASSANVAVSSAQSRAAEVEQSSLSVVSHEDKVIFPQIHDVLRRVLERTRTTLFVVIDEWSS